MPGKTPAFSKWEYIYACIHIYRLPRLFSGKESISAGDTGDMGLIPGLGRSPRGGNGIPHQYSYLTNPVERGAWWATVHGVAKSWTQLCDWAHTYMYKYILLIECVDYRYWWSPNVPKCMLCCWISKLSLTSSEQIHLTLWSSFLLCMLYIVLHFFSLRDQLEVSFQLG